ncbi:MAG: TMEM175 family protein [Bacteroidota bacterium]
MEQGKGWFSKPRVETFSDGVFAIIITILVLELKVPHIEHPNDVAELASALWLILPKFFSWVISFFMICVIWVNHHRIFESITHVTHRIFWLNAYLLLWCAFIPFPTALVGDYPFNPLGLFIFGIVLGLMGLGFTLLRRAITKEQLLAGHINPKAFKKGNKNALIYGVILYLAGGISAWIHPIIALVIFAFIPVYFIFFNVQAGIENA